MPIHILSPAKVNLFLRVTGKRPDGYHNLYSLMCRVGLFDEIHLRPTRGATTLKCSDPLVPQDDTNLACRAARAFFEALGRSGAVELVLEKRIPVAAGLGGGSSNAASVLLGLNQMHGFPFSRKGLMAIGRTLGADVPFFIFQTPALASGIGDLLTPYVHIPPLHLLLVTPGFAVSTRKVYQGLNLRLTKCKKQLKKKSFTRSTAFDPRLHLCNDLETVTLALHPELVAIKQWLAAQGAVGTLMSGSGPTLFGAFPGAGAARSAAAGLPAGRGWRVFAAGLLREPLELIRAA
jgi:4-diphosphocytidyl-2-C-methyl-D-erythritol kinase